MTTVGIGELGWGVRVVGGGGVGGEKDGQDLLITERISYKKAKVKIRKCDSYPVSDCESIHCVGVTHNHGLP